MTQRSDHICAPRAGGRYARTRRASRTVQTAYPTSGSRSVQIFLPIADIPVNVFLVLAMGLAVGFISGMFGIGGGFLMTPLLIFIGVQPAVAVASVTTHVAASSFSGAIAYWRRNAIDVTLALTLLAGGIIGSAGGVALFTWLRAQDQLDLVIGLSYVTLLSIVGVLLVGESARAISPRPPRQAGRVAPARAAMSGSTGCR